MPLYDTSTAKIMGTVYVFVDSSFITDRFENYSLPFPTLPQVTIGDKDFIIEGKKREEI